MNQNEKISVDTVILSTINVQLLFFVNVTFLVTFESILVRYKRIIHKIYLTWSGVNTSLSASVILLTCEKPSVIYAVSRRFCKSSCVQSNTLHTDKCSSK